MCVWCRGSWTHFRLVRCDGIIVIERILIIVFNQCSPYLHIVNKQLIFLTQNSADILTDTHKKIQCGFFFSKKIHSTMTFHFTFSLHVKKLFPLFLTLSLPGPSQRKKRTFLKKNWRIIAKKIILYWMWSIFSNPKLALVKNSVFPYYYNYYT